MSVVTLARGDIVNFKEAMTHKADMVHSEIREKNRVDGKIGAYAGKLAFDATLPHVVQSIERDGKKIELTQEWLDNLPMEEYEKLGLEMVRLLELAYKKIEEGKKNS